MKLKDLFSDSGQITRIIILVVILLGLLVVSFGGYYYWDRYVHTGEDQSPIAQSITELEQGVHADPSDLETSMMLAETYMYAGRYGEAIDLAQQVYDLKPDNQAAMFVLGVSLASTEQHGLAVEPLKSFVDARDQGETSNMDKILETALYFLGDSYIAVDQAEDAIPALLRALEINRTDADAMYKLGTAYAAAGQHEEALASYENAIRFVPDFAEVYEGMVESYEALNMPTKASYARGMLAYAGKDLKMAKTELETVIAADSNFIPAYLGLGLVLEQEGDYEGAKAYAETALELDPDNLAAMQLKGRLDAAIGN
ncbi:MAG: tetratricopeptide repeat protein [Chloroflexota bacterium]